MPLAAVVTSPSWTREERAALIAFKDRLKDLDLDGYPVLEDRRLINWLRARNLKLSEAEAMLRKHLKWRQELHIDSILVSPNMPEDAYKTFPSDLIGVDKDGNPILAVFAGKFDLKKKLQKYGKAVGLRVVHHVLETAAAELVRKSTDPHVFRKLVYILDMEGIKIKEYMSTEAIEALMELVQCVEANYPEMLQKAYLVNAPFIFSTVWSILKPFLAPKTLEKVSIIGYDFEKIRNALTEQIHDSQLPRKFGGKGFSKNVPAFNVRQLDKIDPHCSDLIFKELKIAAGEKLQLEYTITEPDTVLRYTFKMRNYDIGFIVLRRSKQSRFGDDGNGDEPSEISIYQRITSQKAVSGSVICEAGTKYILHFDNTYSRLREKRLLYHVEMTVNNEDVK